MCPKTGLGPRQDINSQALGDWGKGRLFKKIKLKNNPSIRGINEDSTTEDF